MATCSSNFRGVSGVKIVPALSVVNRLIKEVSLRIFTHVGQTNRGGGPWLLSIQRLSLERLGASLSGV